MSATLSDDQRRWLAITPKLTASISFFSTVFIIWDVLRSKTKRDHTYHQFIVALSVCDLLIALGTFLSTWPIPSTEQGVWGASGTQQTCTAQGFVLQFTITAPLYNGSLSLYYVLMITFNWSERRLKRMRLWVHVSILAFGIGTSVAGLFLTLYNSANLWCWIASSPSGCVETVASPAGQDTTCVRGDNANSIYRWAFYYIPLWFVIAFSTLAMLLTWSSLKEKGKQAENVLRTSFCNADSNRLLEKLRRKERERNVMIQCLFYLTAFYMTWVCPTALRVKQSTSGTPSFGLLLCVGFLLPFQGFANCLVYLRPRFQKYKKRNRGRRSIISYDGLKSIFIEQAGEEEDDFNVAPSGNEDEDIDREKRSSQEGGSTRFRFRDSFGAMGRSKRSGLQSSTGSPPQSRVVRFSQIESQIEDAQAVSKTSSIRNIMNVGSSRSSVASAEEKCEDSPARRSKTSSGSISVQNGNATNACSSRSTGEEKPEETSPI
mmetsp:Transcript_16053/g.46084  ORF Transcript_16053/g.46084 Transcript_16053/m.46084 type:complete len:490 (-) Transcript_16053:1226-2695(-)